MKLGDYETVNPGQDFNDEEADLFKPPEDAETAADVRRPNATVVKTERAVEQATQQAVALAVEETVRAISPTLERRSMSPQMARGRTSLGVGIEEREDMANRYSQASTLEPLGGERDLEKGE